MFGSHAAAKRKAMQDFVFKPPWILLWNKLQQYFLPLVIVFFLMFAVQHYLSVGVWFQGVMELRAGFRRGYFQDSESADQPIRHPLAMVFGDLPEEFLISIGFVSLVVTIPFAFLMVVLLCMLAKI